MDRRAKIAAVSWLITPTELNELPDPSPRVLDVRWKLTEPDGREAYRAGHIPGAVYVDLDASCPITPAPGRDATRCRASKRSRTRPGAGA